MTPSLFVWSAAIALAFVAWPILSSKSGAPGAWIGLLILIGSTIGTALVGTRDIIASPLPVWKAVGIVVAAGIVNGIAVYYYGLKAADPAIPTGLFVTTMVVFMALFAPVVDWLVKGATLSTQQMVGIALAGVALYLIKG